MKNYLYLFCLLFLPAALQAAFDTTNIPFNRVIFHDKIKAGQKNIDKADGKLDGIVRATFDNEVNLQVTDALFRKINILRNKIETDDRIASNNDKVRYLRYTEYLLKSYLEKWLHRDIQPAIAPALVEGFGEVMALNMDGEDMTPAVKKMSYEVASLIAPIFIDNPGYVSSQDAVYLKYCHLNPDKIMSTLEDYVDKPFADSLVLQAFKYSPSMLYSYAQSVSSKQGQLLRRIEDPRIKAVVQLSTQQRALFYFPFLDELISGKQTIESIQKVAGTSNSTYDSLGYYSLLVKTEIDYQQRVIQADTPIAMYGPNGLQDMIQQKALQHFVTPVNDLHEFPNNIRFRAIEPLSAQELYYVMLAGENDLFTSSYKYIFDKFMARLGTNPRGDEFLQSIYFDRFKKFIKMMAGYGRLDRFLSTMPQNAETLMKAFVSKLEVTGTLEDAVDVADSYGSVSPAIQKSMMADVEWNLRRVKTENNEKGEKIYGLLRLIFLSADPASGVDLTKEVGIPPIYSVDYKYLADEKDRVVQMAFFYGDADGITSFNSYLSSFPRGEWSVVRKNEWVEIKSTSGKPVWIFANLPLDNNTGKDGAAQEKMIAHIADLGLKPTIVIHRGHSYHLPYTIQKLPQDAKVVMLGSCGGYNNLKDILKYSPDAHIISTKQIGTTNVNKVIIDALDNTLRAGKDIDWREMWKSLETRYSRESRAERETFEDYIPPQKNLGAIFIKAYTKMGGMDEGE